MVLCLFNNIYASLMEYCARFESPPLLGLLLRLVLKRQLSWGVGELGGLVGPRDHSG